MPHGITQCYLPPGRGDIPALTPAEAGTRLSDPGGMQGLIAAILTLKRNGTVSVRPSVCLSLCPSTVPTAANALLQVCCCESGGEQKISIDRCRQPRAAAECGQCHVVSCRRKLDA